MPTFVLASLATLLILAILLRRRKSDIPYPPGPKPKPIVGNAFDLPKKKPWLGYMDISKRLNSGIIHFSAMKTHIVVINKMEDAVALLDKRSAVYSSRPILKVRELVHMDRLTTALTYGNEWRKHRRIFQEGLKKESMSSYYSFHMDKVHFLLVQLLRNPADFVAHCKALGASITLGTAFGYELHSQKYDPLVRMGDIITKGTAELVLPGRTLIHVIPFLAYIPPWFPGAATQRFAAYIGQIAMKYTDEPYEYVKRSLATGTATSCLLTELLQNNATRREGAYEEKVIKDAMATLYFAGGETLQSAQTIFIFTMALHPQEQRKAQEEIDRIVGTDRLPTFEDRPHLPYVEALYREVLRWHPVLPLNLAHSNISNDVYNGFLIPEKAIVFANIWAISRDEAVYRQPDTFMPERFFDEDGTLNSDTANFVFGFGRRICAGKHVADSVLWLVIVSILSTFNIAKAKNDAGNEIDIDATAFADSFVSFPLPFKCSITPRSPQAELLIRATTSKVESGS